MQPASSWRSRRRARRGPDNARSRRSRCGRSAADSSARTAATRPGRRALDAHVTVVNATPIQVVVEVHAHAADLASTAARRSQQSRSPSRMETAPSLQSTSAGAWPLKAAEITAASVQPMRWATSAAVSIPARSSRSHCFAPRARLRRRLAHEREQRLRCHAVMRARPVAELVRAELAVADLDRRTCAGWTCTTSATCGTVYVVTDIRTVSHTLESCLLRRRSQTTSPTAPSAPNGTHRSS